MKFPVFFLCPIIVTLLTSCITIRFESVGHYSDYDKLSEEQKTHVVLSSASIDSLTYDGTIYVVSIEQVKDFIAAHDTAEVFFWNPACSAEGCSTPQMFEDAASIHHAAPCILVTSFYGKPLPGVGELKSPLLFIDVRKYNTQTIWRYSRAIRKDLTGLDYDKKEDRAVLEKTWSLLFHHGQFVPQEKEEKSLVAARQFLREAAQTEPPKYVNDAIGLSSVC